MRHATHAIALPLLALLAALHLGAGPATAQTQTCQHVLSYPSPINSPIVLDQQGSTVS